MLSWHPYLFAVSVSFQGKRNDREHNDNVEHQLWLQHLHELVCDVVRVPPVRAQLGDWFEFLRGLAVVSDGQMSDLLRGDAWHDANTKMFGEVFGKYGLCWWLIISCILRASLLVPTTARHSGPRGLLR